jgi:hypothetical protein
LEIFLKPSVRFSEKRDFVLHWLLEFRFSTTKVLCDALGVKRTSQTRFFVSLKKTGLFETVLSPQVNDRIWILSYEGKQFAYLLAADKAARYRLTKSRIVSSTVIHSLCIQEAIISRGKNQFPFLFRSEQFLDFTSAVKTPDAVFDDDGSLVALEVELTQKNSKRIYLGFVNHVTLMKEGHYSKVDYVFPSEALCNIYKRRFDQPEWPLFFRDKHGVVQPRLDGGKQVYVKADSDVIRSSFSFVAEDFYWGKK